MTPAEQALLVHVAEVDRSNVLQLIFELLFYGVHLPLFIHAVLIIKPRIRARLPARWLYALVIILFSLNTIRLVLMIDMYILLNNWPKLGSLEDTLRTKLDLANLSAYKQLTALSFMGQTIIALADVIVVWRAYVLWAENVRVRVALLAGLAITVALGIVNAVTSSIVTLNIEGRDKLVIADRALSSTRDFTSFVVNIAATACIGIRFRNLRSMYQKDEKALARSRVARTMSLMVEGGVVLAIIQLVAAVMGACIIHIQSPNALSMASHVLIETLISVAAIYPCIVTILLSSKNLKELDNPTSTKIPPPTESEKQTGAGSPRKPQLSTIRFIPQDSTIGDNSDAAASHVDVDIR